MIDKDSPIVKEFLVESLEALSSISEELTAYEKIQDESQADEQINSIYRKVHTLKGSASFLSLKKLESLAHSAESILDYLREKQLQVNERIIDKLLESFDVCLDMVRSIETAGNEGNLDVSDLILKIESLLENELTAQIPLGDAHALNGEVQSTNSINTESVNTKDSLSLKTADVKETNIGQSSKDQLTDKNTSVVKQEVPKMAESKKRMEPRKSNKVEPVKTDTSTQTKSVADSTVRVNVKLLDKILNVVGELVLNRNQILQHAAENEEPHLSRLSHQLNVITSELQADIMKTRMQPVSAILSKFERVVRDLARSQKKKVKLEIQGQETELDKTLLEIIKDPLTHLIRNACDHGLETPEKRRANGKDETGHLLIATSHSGGQVSIDISDDGNGISVEKVKEKAVSKGILSAAEAEELSDKKAMNLIFAPGFSTAEQVTNISGRGVGMDVVKSNIEKIGGQCQVESIEGKGTTFKLQIPLTLAIIPALVINSGNETFAISQKNLVELVLLEDYEKDKIERIHDSEFFRLRGDLIPIIRLNSVLGIDDKKDLGHTNIIVLQADIGTYGLVVDEILDTQEIVVKPLSHKLKVNNIYAGATIMGNGNVALILDAKGIYSVVDKGQVETQSSIGDHQSLNENDIDIEEILLFQLHDERYYGIPLCLVDRLEEFSSDKLQLSGKQKLIRYRDMAMPIIDLNREVDYTNKPIDSDIEVSVVPSIVCKIRNRTFGFSVKSIQDIGRPETEIEYNSSSHSIMGTVYINGKLVTIIDVHQIVDKLELATHANTTNFKAKVLLAEDSILYQRVLQEALEANGFYVQLAENGQLALDYSLKSKYDILVTDIEMPLLNGFELTKKIKANDQYGDDFPVIAVTTRVSEQDLEHGKHVGITSHLKKINQDEVIKKVNDLISIKEGA